MTHEDKTKQPADEGRLDRRVRPLVESLRTAADVWGNDDGGRLYAAAADEIELLLATEEGALTAFAHVVEQKHEIERENAKLRRLLDAAYADIRRLKAA